MKTKFVFLSLLLAAPVVIGCQGLDRVHIEIDKNIHITRMNDEHMSYYGNPHTDIERTGLGKFNSFRSKWK